MNIRKIVRQVKQSYPGFERIPDATAVALLRDIFNKIGNDIEQLEAGTIDVVGLGQFEVSNDRRQNSEEAATVKIALFMPVVPQKSTPAKK